MPCHNEKTMQKQSTYLPCLLMQQAPACCDLYCTELRRMRDKDEADQESRKLPLCKLLFSVYHKNHNLSAENCHFLIFLIFASTVE